MATIFFSGGIDSTVLAFDVAKNPWRYGISPKLESFRLVSAVFDPREDHIPIDMAEIVKQIFDEANYNEWGSVEHKRFLVPLKSYEKLGIPHGGANSLTPLSSKYVPDVASISFTPGLHTWLAMLGMNLEWFDRSISHFSDPTCFFGFQFDGPVWEQYDRGEMVPNDVSPDFIKALNILAKSSSPRPGVVFRAPFLESRMDRTHVIEMGLSLGAPVDLTSSCEKGWGVACGYCGQCLRRGRSVAYLKAQHEEFMANQKNSSKPKKKVGKKK